MGARSNCEFFQVSSSISPGASKHSTPCYLTYQGSKNQKFYQPCLLFSLWLFVKQWMCQPHSHTETHIVFYSAKFEELI